jgi:hypothetical protein
MKKNDFLKHYGVKGQRWGVRKRVVSADHHAVSSLRGKKLHEMSNDEIRSITARMDLERRYRDLHPNRLKRGAMKFAAIMAGLTALSTAGTQAQKLAEVGKKVMAYYNQAKVASKLGNVAAASAKAALKG